jgi:hypothetical protein
VALNIAPVFTGHPPQAGSDRGSRKARERASPRNNFDLTRRNIWGTLDLVGGEGRLPVRRPTVQALRDLDLSRRLRMDECRRFVSYQESL